MKENKLAIIVGAGMMKPTNSISTYADYCCEFGFKELYSDSLVDNIETKKSHKKFTKLDQLQQSNRPKGI